ncbi:tyrosine--tRNA ligase [Holospora elegans E1]|uniref:Tyrosine--tRNA ligase n=1 Tax=Holospora elegans E1 TaxID=1427503 RepID=A0A023DZD0_9PROT|nr:hypothetical protein [Holospora elegans]GAJ46287.1 tyrosine--tRNA ligase [Holospora elegans E1]
MKNVLVKGLKKIALLGKKIPDHVRSIEIKEDIQDLENLKKIDFNKVESLEFSYVSYRIHPEFQLKNLVGAKFPHLKFLSIYKSDLKDISSLKDIPLPSLEELVFEHNFVKDISVFKTLSLPKLKKLSFGGCDVKDITPLFSFSAPNLEKISFHMNEEASFSLKDAEKLKKQFPLLKKIIVLRTEYFFPKTSKDFPTKKNTVVAFNIKMPHWKISKDLFSKGVTMVDILKHSGLVESCSEARRKISEGIVKIRNRVWKNHCQVLTNEDIPQGWEFIHCGKDKVLVKLKS